MSPKPTVAMVTTAQYMLLGMLVKPWLGPSITYIMVPAMMVMVMTVNRNNSTLRRLRHSDSISTPLSSM